MENDNDEHQCPWIIPGPAVQVQVHSCTPIAEKVDYLALSLYEILSC